MAQVNMPNTPPREDALTTLMKGLTIASQIYGIRSDMARLDQYAEQKADKDRMAQGNFNKDELLKIGQNYQISPTKPEGDSIQISSADNPGSPLYASVYKQKVKPDYQKIDTVNDQGQKVTTLFDPVSGKTAGQFVSYEKPSADKFVKVETVDENGNPVTKFVTPSAGASYKMASTASLKQPNKDQFDAALFGKRMETANDVMNNLSSDGFDRSSYLSGLSSAVLPEAVQGSLLKQQNQAERNFVNAVLRRESGAAIAQSEFDSAAKQYFPRAGDTPEVLAQKAQNREQAVQGMKAAAGNAWAIVPTPGITAPRKKDTSGEAFAGEANQQQQGPSPLDLLKIKAKNGDKKAQDYLNSLNKGQ